MLHHMLMDQVESDHNFSIVMDFLASFADDIPPANDIKDMPLNLQNVNIIYACIYIYICINIKLFKVAAGLKLQRNYIPKLLSYT